MVATALASSGRWPWRRLDSGTRLARPAVLPLAPLHVTSTDTLQPGETLGDVLERQGLIPGDLLAIFQRVGLDPRRLRAGLVVHFGRRVEEPSPSEIRIRVSPNLRFAAWREARAWTARSQPVPWRREVLRLDGPIDNSLYDALDQRIPDEVLDAPSRVRLAWDLADVYAWSLDFNRDIQAGDRFAVLVEREVSDEGELRLGRILAADLLTSGKHLPAYRFDLPGEGPRYFDADGNSLRRNFLRAPVEFRRIASGFSRSRFHPVLGIWRRHQGTDYAADRGTPVLAAGDGTVLSAGWMGGYGNLIELRHPNGITTRYGHLRGYARGVQAGARVKQGEVIGYVGATGLASGPHLHFEFRIRGVARDPRRMDPGPGVPLPASLRAQFAAERARLAEALNGG
ncbi:MAG TPA: M23 family metallopeptidase, partial [Gemmatimonadales bacterium]|nr:M23 family metallopeptidase [Gemmatimonadales bacterium]